MKSTILLIPASTPSANLSPIFGNTVPSVTLGTGIPPMMSRYRLRVGQTTARQGSPWSGFPPIRRLAAGYPVDTGRPRTV